MIGLPSRAAADRDVQNGTFGLRPAAAAALVRSVVGRILFVLCRAGPGAAALVVGRVGDLSCLAFRSVAAASNFGIVLTLHFKLLCEVWF